MLNNISIGTKILGLVLFVIMVMGASNLVGIFAMNSLGQEIKDIAEEDLPIIKALTHVTVKQLEQEVLLEKALRGVVRTSKSASGSEIKSKFDQYSKEIEAAIEETLKDAEHGLANAHTDEARKEFDHIEQVMKKIKTNYLAYETHASDLFASIAADGESENLTEKAEKIEHEAEQMEHKLVALLEELETFTSRSALQAEAHEQQAMQVIIISSIFSVILGLAIGYFISKRMARSLGNAARVAEEIAEGDLTREVRLEGTDEVGRLLASLHKMNENLHEVITKVSISSQNIVSGSQEIASGNINLSQRTEEQASSLEETASSMEEMTSTVKQNASSAQEASELAQETSQQAVNGGDVVMQAVDAMSEISESSARIADIIATIDGIAFQTNLLALNAAVEAARAGEQGRGFAVVASEVRSLAQRSADAAKEIKSLIGDSVDKVKNGARLVDESGQTLAGIVTGMKKVNAIVAEIASASTEQSAGIEQVNTAVTQMDDMTQQNAALVEESTAATRAMEEQVKVQAEIIGFFKLKGNAQTKQVNRQNSAGASENGRPVMHVDHDQDDKKVSQFRAQGRKTGTNDQQWENF